MKTFSFFFVALLTLTGTLLAFQPRVTGEGAGTDPIEREGVISRWLLQMDGTIFIQLREAPTQSDEQGRELWYRSPPDRSTTMNVEEMILYVVLAAEMAESPMTFIVRAQEERGLDGSSLEDAYPLTMIARSLEK